MIVVNEFVVPVRFPGLPAVRRERLLPLRHNGSAFGVQRLLPFRCSRSALGVYGPGVADLDRYAVESVRALEYSNVALKLADYRRLNDSPGECIVNPVDTPQAGLWVIGANC